jgi:hypothetical protein
MLGYYEIAKQYLERYNLPIVHTETNRKDDADAPRWLLKEWFNILRLKADGKLILGFTWYSLLDQTDWDVALREDNERINPLGLFDLNRKIRAVGQTYRQLIADWHRQLPLESLVRDLSREDAAAAARRQPRHTARNASRSRKAALYGGNGVYSVKEYPPKPRARKVANAE